MTNRNYALYYVPIMYVDSAKTKIKGRTYSRHLIRRSYREGGKVKQETIANISQCPSDVIQRIKDLLAGKLVPAELNLEEKKMKAIIIAAGPGSRLKHLTNDKPKCMLEFSGKTLLRTQVEALKACGIEDIVVIKGYQNEKINYPDLRYYINDNYKNNNILNSLFYAEPEMDDEVVISYSDILYSENVVARLLKSKADISIVVDIDWRGYYEGRTDHPIEQAENVILDSHNDVIEIGKIVTNKDDVHGEFIGMMKCTKRGIEILKRHFHRAKQLFRGKPYQRAATFEQAYLTDIIQDMVDLGVPIHCVIIERGWREIDTIQDYERAIESEL